MDQFQTLVISLPQSLTRQDQVKKILSQTELNWQFLEGIDGRKLQYPPPEYLPHKVERLLGFKLTPNEIGCFLSHRKAWQSCSNLQLPTLIFEDDFLILPNFNKVLSTLLDNLGQWQLVRLQALVNCDDKPEYYHSEFDLVHNQEDPLGATAYLLQPNAAKILLDHSKLIFEPLDHFLEHYQKHGIRMLAVKPYPAEISKAPSTITDRPNNRKPIKGLKKLCRSVFRKIDRLFSKEPWFPK